MKLINVVVLSVLILPAQLLGQDSSNLSPGEYAGRYDSLQTLKQKLQSQKKDLKDNLEELESRRDRLKNEFHAEQLSLYKLKYGKEYGERVYNDRIWKGMTREMLRDSWGEPDSLNKSRKDWGTFSQWYYGDEYIFFFRDGKLFEWKGEGEEVRKRQ